MADYIDRHAAIEVCKNDYAHGYMYAYCLKQLPSADVVEVVRCKDCKWFNKIGCAIKIVDESDKPHEDDFCSFAERRADV